MSNTSDKMHADNNKHQNDYGNGNNDASSFRQNSNDQYNAEGGNSYGGNNGSSYAPNHGEDDGDFNSGDNDDNISAISNVSKSSKGHGGDHHSSHKGKSSGNGSSSSHKGKGDHSNSSSVKGGGKNSGTKIDTAPIHENEVFHDSAAGKGSYSENNSLKSNGKVGSEIGKGSASVSLAGKTNTSDKGHVTSTRLGQPNKVMDDESSIESGFPVAGGSGFTNIPPDVTELMRILKEKEAVLIKRETDIENEVKQKVKEYIRSHGIGYQKKSISGASILEPKLLEDSDGVMREEGHDDNPDRNKDGEIVFRDSLTNEYGGSSLLRDASLQRSNSFQMPTSGRARSRDGGSRDGDNNSPSKSRQTSRERKMDQTQLEQNKFKELHDLKNKNTGTSGRPNSRGTRQGTWRTITPLPRALDSQEIKSRVDVEQSYPHLGTLHEIIDLIVNNINHKFNGDLKTLDLIKIVTPKIPIKQDMSTDTEDLDAKKPWELPIYHNHANLMITRTYKVTPELQSFLDKLATDDNPLKLIFDEFGDFLPALQKERLSFAAMSYPERKHRDQVAQKLPVTSQDWFKLNTNLYGSMNELFEACMNMLPMISAIEKIAHEVIQFIKSMKKSGIVNIADIRSLMQNNSSNIKLLQGSLVDLYRYD